MNVIEKYSDPSIDLNKLSKEELDLVKGEMDVEFEKKQIKPGDENFKYDVEVDFEEGDESNEWDEGISSDYEVSEEESFNFDFVNGDKI